MKIKGEEILEFHVEGEEQGHIQTCKTLVECYELINDLKKQDRKENIKDTYYIQCATESAIYGDYTIRRYKNKLYLK